jgi:hypothetical protein
MNTNTATEYRNLPLAVLTESATNPRRIFEDSSLKEFAAFVPGNKSGLLWRLAFCCRGGGKPHGNTRSAILRVHNGKGVVE